MKQKIEHYEILKKIDSGRTGTIYKGIDEHTNESVAIKMLDERFILDKDLHREIFNSAMIVRTLDHPNLLKVRDYIDNGKSIYLIMEHTERRKLGDIFKKDGSGLPYKYVLPLFRQILMGLGHAHQRGIIHADLKPIGVIVKRDNTVKVTGCGLSNFRSYFPEDEEAEISALQYHSPEILKKETLDQRADIYSVGVMLYEALAGIIPMRPLDHFSGANLIDQIISQELPPINEYNSSLPSWLSEGITIAVSKEKENRFQNTEEFLSLLRHS